MANDEDDSNQPVLSATKDGAVIRLSRDPHPNAENYLVTEAPGMLVLFPQNKRYTVPLESFLDRGLAEHSDHDAQLHAAFQVLGARVAPSIWSNSSKPQTTLIDGFRTLATQPYVHDDVKAYITANPSVSNAVQMLFTSLAMSTRADWRAVPQEFRGIAARGWFLGRWIPTFLILDGPILRFLNSLAFQRQEGSTEFLRAVRSFFHAKDFMALRHAFAHWSFSWSVSNGDSMIVATHQTASKKVYISRKEADAFHILTYAVVEAIHDTFIQRI